MRPLFDFFYTGLALITSTWSISSTSAVEVSQSISHYTKKFSMENLELKKIFFNGYVAFCS
jgi:hypothetical protein